MVKAAAAAVPLKKDLLVMFDIVIIFYRLALNNDISCVLHLYRQQIVANIANAVLLTRSKDRFLI